MPGAFNTPMAGVGPISSAAVGLPGINPGAQLAQAVQAFPQQQAEAQQNQSNEAMSKLMLQREQQQNDSQDQAQAVQQLTFFDKMITADQTGMKTKDKQLIQAVTQAGKKAGVAGLVTTDPATGEQVIDVQALNALVNSKLMSQLDSAQQTMIAQAQPSQRPGLYQQFGVSPSSVPTEAMNAQPYLPPKDAASVRQEVAKIFTQSGNQTPSALVAQLNALMPEMASAGLSVDDIKSYLTSPDFLQGQLGPVVQAKINEMNAIGISKEAQTKYLNMKTVEEPKQIASQITTRAGRLVLAQDALNEKTVYDRGRLDVANKNADDQQRKTQGYLDQVQSNIDKAKRGGDLAALGMSFKFAAANLSALKDKRDALAREASTYINASNGKADVPDDITKALQQIDKEISDGQAVLDNGLAIGNQMSGGKFSSMVGKPARVDGTFMDSSGKMWRPNGKTDANGNALYDEVSP